MSKGASVPFIVYNEEKKRWGIHSEGAALLSRLSNPLSVVVVAGKYRSGKSFLMNQLNASNEGKASTASSFAVGHTVESHTKGIWLCDPIKGRTNDGEDIDVLLMDAEGLGATDKVCSYFF